MDVARFSVGQVIRANSCTSFASGKGINAAFAAATLGAPSHVYCIVGEGDVCEFTNLHPLITCNAAIVPGLTRTNVTISQEKINLICHVQTDSSKIDHDFAESIVEQFIRDVTDGDVVVVSGSLPVGVRQELLTGALRQTAKKNAIIIVDVDPVYWSSIDWGVVHWAKPNLEELSRYIGRELLSKSDICRAVLDCHLAIRTVVSLGESGAILVRRERDDWAFGRTRIDFTPTSLSIGCGDSMVGGFAAALSRGCADEEVLKYGLSAGCANLAGVAPGRIDRVLFDLALSSTVVT